jgi:hypothetical protein
MVSVYCTHGKEQTSQFVCRQKKHAGENFVTISEVNYGEHQSRQIKIGSSQGQWSSVMSWYSLRLTKFFAAGESPILVSSCRSVCLYYVNICQIISGYNWNLCIPDWLPATWTSRSNDWKRAWGNGEIVLSQMVSTWPHTWRSPHGHIHGGSAATPWDRLNRKNQWMSEREKGEIQPQNRIHGRSVVLVHTSLPRWRDWSYGRAAVSKRTSPPGAPHPFEPGTSRAHPLASTAAGIFPHIHLLGRLAIGGEWELECRAYRRHHSLR